MGLKSAFTALLTANWGDITSPKRLPVKDREIGTSLSNELWSTTLRERTSFTLVITSLANADLTYNLTFAKTGNKVVLNGTIVNTTAFSIPAGDMVNIIDAEYEAKTLFPTRVVSGSTTILIDGNAIKNTNSIPGNTTLYIDTTYLTND